MVQMYRLVYLGGLLRLANETVIAGTPQVKQA
jgi:hypothetical protein